MIEREMALAHQIRKNDARIDPQEKTGHVKRLTEVDEVSGMSTSTTIETMYVTILADHPAR